MIIISRTKILNIVIFSFLFLHTTNLLADEDINSIQITLKSHEYPHLPKKNGCRFKFELKNNTDISFGSMSIYLHSMEDEKYPIRSNGYETGLLKPYEVITGNISFRDAGCRHVLYGPIKIKILLSNRFIDNNDCSVTGVYRVTPAGFVVREFNLLPNTEDHSIMLYETHETNNGDMYCGQ